MRNQPRNCTTCRYVGAIHMSASESGHFAECKWQPGLPPAPAWLLDAPRFVPIDIARRCECYWRRGEVRCPMCGEVVNERNAGGYRTYCEECVEKAIQ